MIPPVAVDSLLCGFLVLVVSQHDIQSACKNLARNVFGIGALDFHFHVECSLSARTCLEIIPRCIADDGSALGGAITNGIGEVDFLQEFLHVLVECRTSDDDFVEVSTKGIHHLFADLLVHLPVDDRHLPQNLNAIRLYLREHLLLDDFLDDKRYGDDDCGFDIGKGLCDDGWAWHACKEENVFAGQEFVGELKGHSIHVGQRKDADDVVSLEVCPHHFHGEVEVAP